MYKILTITILTFLSQTVNAQTKNWRINIGAGFPEFTHLGIGYKFANKNLVSLNYGFMPGFDHTFNVITLDHSYFLKNSRKFEELKTWYFGQKLNYFREIGKTLSSPEIKYENVFIGLDIGRQFNFSKSFGLSFDIGVAYNIIDEKNYVDSSNGNLNPETPLRIYPTSNLQFFYRL